MKKSKKITFFKKKIKFLKIHFFRRKKYKKNNAIILVLQIEEISLRPELSSPPRFRIPPERDGVVVVGVAGQHFPFLI